MKYGLCYLLPLRCVLNLCVCVCLRQYMTPGKSRESLRWLGSNTPQPALGFEFHGEAQKLKHIRAARVPRVYYLCWDVDFLQRPTWTYFVAGLGGHKWNVTRVYTHNRERIPKEKGSRATRHKTLSFHQSSRCLCARCLSTHASCAISSRSGFVGRRGTSHQSSRFARRIRPGVVAVSAGDGFIKIRFRWVWVMASNWRCGANLAVWGESTGGKNTGPQFAAVREIVKLARCSG